MIVVTTEHVSGYRISRHRGLVSGHGRVEPRHVDNLFAPLPTKLIDRMREQSPFEKAFFEARNQALQAMCDMAEGAGAHAVIGVRINTEVLTGQKGKQVYHIFAYGTAVELERLHADGGDDDAGAVQGFLEEEVPEGDDALYDASGERNQFFDEEGN